MWATLAIASALSLAPAQAGKLEIKNHRITYGILGQERKENKILAGDVLYVTYDVDGLQVTPDGRVRYKMTMELLNDQGKAVFSEASDELEVTNALGGSRLPAFARSQIGTETEPGKYTMKVTVTDIGDKNKPTATLSRPFEVVPRAFGFVRVELTTVPVGPKDNMLPVPPIAVPGQTLMLNFALAGFDSDAKAVQPDLAVDLAVEMRILDEAGKPTLAKPFTGDAKKIGAPYAKLLPMQFVLPINRSGKFTIELKATDNKTKKTALQTLSLVVMEIPK